MICIFNTLQILHKIGHVVMDMEYLNIQSGQESNFLPQTEPDQLRPSILEWGVDESDPGPVASARCWQK